MKYGTLIEKLHAQPLALLPSRLAALTAAIQAHDPDEEVDDELLAARAAEPVLVPISESFALWDVGDDELAARAQAAVVRGNPRSPGAVAVIPFLNFVQQREDIFTRYGMAVSTEAFVRRVRGAIADPNVKAIVFDVDSPGGMVDGVPEASAAIHGLRGQKPMIAVSNPLMASAAYWVASAADEVVASPSSDTGSIGVWTLVMDAREMFAQSGIKVDMVKAGKYKVFANPFEETTDEVLARVQSHVDGVYEHFVADVARNRKDTASSVRAGYGEGDVVAAKAAKAAKLVDRVATLEETLARFGAGPANESTSRALEEAAGPVSALQREKAKLSLAKAR